MRWFVTVIGILLATPAWADFDDGLAAYNRGDYATALREWRPLAEQGHAAAQFKLGFMHLWGDGVAKNHNNAVGWIRKAVEQDHAEAQYYLGLMYNRGWGVPSGPRDTSVAILTFGS